MKPPINGADYQRIFRTIYSVLERDMGDFTGACFYFNLIGSAILKQHYGLEAIPLVGSAGYCLGGKEAARLVYASFNGNMIDQDGENVHCWIQADGWHIDFMAPLFPLIAQKGNLPPCKSKMMCKPRTKAKESLEDLREGGDFFVWPSIERTRRELSRYLSNPVVSDFAQICCMWFERPPQKMEKSVPIQTSKGEIYRAVLTEMRVEGSW